MRYKTVLTYLLLICFIALPNIVKAQNGGPYSADANTLLLMHFDNDLSTLGNYTGSVTNWGNNFLYEDSKSNFEKCYRINNANGLQCLLLDVTSELDLGNNWTVEFWVKIGSYGSGAAEYPTIFIKDGEGMTAVNIGFRKDGLGFNSEVTFSDQSQIRIEQENGIQLTKWHHVALVSNASTRKISLIIHDENWLKVFSQSKSFPGSTDGTLCTAERQMFLGGVDGSSNIQFDGWIDEFRISNTARDFSAVLPDLPMQAETENLEFYSTNEQASNWTSMTQSIQNECVELCSYWDRPMRTSVLPETKIKLYLLTRDELMQYSGIQLPDWKCGWIDKENNIVVVTLPETEEHVNYYGSFEALAKGTLAQLMVHRKLLLKENISSKDYFLEGFGLYRGGYRPDRNIILQAINDLGRLPQKSDIVSADNFNVGWMKDLITSFIECQLFNGISYQGITTWMQNDLWHPYFNHFYQKEEKQRIKLQRVTANFDIYGADQEIPYLDSISDKLEEKLEHYENCYEMDIKNRFNVVIFTDENTGMACMGYGDVYNGGSGCGGDKLDILSPVHFSGGIDEALLSLIPHEFFHVFHNHMAPSPEQVVGFHAEGMAELMAYEDDCANYLANLSWYIKQGLEKFQNQYGREPKLADIMPDTDGYMSVYTFGQAFWYYMHTNHSDYTTIRDFFTNGLDWNVFNVSYEEIDAGYINYLKQLAGITNVEEKTKSVPTQFELFQNYPNPFNPKTNIKYNLPEAGFVSLKIYDSLGREIKTLVNEEQSFGSYKIDFYSNELSSGIYFYRLKTKNYSETKKMILLK